MLRRWFLEKLFSHLDCRGRVRAAVAGTLVVSFGMYACSPPAKPPVATSPVSNVLRSETTPTDVDKLLETLAKLPRRARRKAGDSGRTTSADQQSTAKVSSMKDLRLLIARRIGMPWSELEARCAEAVQKSKEHADWKFEFPIADELRAMIAQKRTQFDKFNEVQRKTIEDADASLAAFLASGKKLQTLQEQAKKVFDHVRDNVEDITAEISRIEALEEAGKPVEEELKKLLAEDGIVATALDDLESDRSVLESLAHALQASRDELQAAAEALKATLKVLAEVHPDVGPLVKQVSDAVDKTLETIVKVFLALTNPFFLLYLLFTALFGSPGGGEGGEGDGQKGSKGSQEGTSDRPSESQGATSIGPGKEKFDGLPDQAKELPGFKRGEDGDWIWLPYAIGDDWFIGLRNKKQASISEELRFNLGANADLAPLEQSRKAGSLTVGGIHAPDLYPLTMKFTDGAKQEWRLRWKERGAAPILLKGYAAPTDIPPDATAQPIDLADSLEEGEHSYAAIRESGGAVRLRIYIRKSNAERVELPLPIDELGGPSVRWRLTGVTKLGPSAKDAYPVELLISTDGGKSTTHRVLYLKAGDPPRVVTGGTSASAT